MPPALDGTFDFCSRCSQHNNCCVRTRHAIGEVASPPLLPHEGLEIAETTGLAIEEFTEETTPSGNGLAIKRIDSGCFFYRDGKCNIYSVRPFDCRIFPFDIREVAGELHWVVYTDLCPVRFNYEHHFASAKHILSSMEITLDELKAFTRHGEAVMAPHGFKLLDRVELPARRRRAVQISP